MDQFEDTDVAGSITLKSCRF